MVNKRNITNSRFVSRVDEVIPRDIFDFQQDNSLFSESIPASKLQWNGASPEQLEFMRRVYNYHVKTSAQKRPFVQDVPAAELAVIEAGHRAKIAADQACQDLLAAARASLDQQQRDGVQQALSVKHIILVSAYRSASEQFAIWQQNFPDYYQQTASKRAALFGGEHGEKAVGFLAGYISCVLAAPGYSLHNNGLAVDFGTREKGDALGAKKAQRQQWKQSWLFGWLMNNASQFNYYQNTSIDEPWHWEYRESISQPSQNEFSDFWEFDLVHKSLLEPAPVDDERFNQEHFGQQELAFLHEDLNLLVYTVVDKNALIRSGPPQWLSLGNHIPQYTRVRILELQGKFAKVVGKDGSEYGWTARSNLRPYYKDSDRLLTVPLEPSSPLSILEGWTQLKRNLVGTYNRLGGLMNVLTTELSIQLPAILAVWQVESGGRTHIPSHAVIRFENHLFFKKWGNHNQATYNKHFQHGGHNSITGKVWENHKFRQNLTDPFQSFHGNQEMEYQVLAFASQLAGEDIALQCISIGGPQILISHYQMLGYSTPRAMYDAFQSEERLQVLGFFDFCQYKLNGRRLLKHLAALRWENFAEGYNGTGQIKQYSALLRQSYQTAQQILASSPNTSQSVEIFRSPTYLSNHTFNESAKIAAGRDELIGVPLLQQHRGTPPDLILRWNDMAVNPTSVDVVVHLHGYSDARDRMVINRTKEPNSGFINPNNPNDLSLGRTRPTLAVLPRGHYFGGKSGKGYDFPALVEPTGLRELVEFSLKHFSRGFGFSNLQIGRLIITAHSGGGASLMRILQHNNPHEVHVFDALYQDASNLIRWVQNRIQRDQDALDALTSQDARQYMQEQGGALRVFYLAGTGTDPYSRAVHRALLTTLPVSSRISFILADWYRVERTSVTHGDIPRYYGFQLLGNVNATLPNTF